MARPSKGRVLEYRGKRDLTYALRFSAGGRRRHLTLGGTEDGWTRKRAEEELERTLAAIKLGIWKPPTAEPVVEEPEAEPNFHELSSAWVERRRHEVDTRSIEFWTWALSVHVLPFFAAYLPSQITVELVERFKAGKLAEREERLAAIERWKGQSPATRGRMPARPLGNESINKCLKVLAQVLDDAVEYGYLESNPARGKRRRLKTTKPRRTWLELHEVQAVLSAAGDHRALIATMILAGLRVGELCSVRWRDVDLASGKLRIEDAKTAAGLRTIDITPMLLDDLKLHRASAEFDRPTDLVFATSRGTKRNRSNITRQILQPTIDRANVLLAEDGRTEIDGVTNHSLRRTFCALLYEAGATPAYVMAQMGHTDASLALEIYSKVMERKRDTGARMDALIRGPVLAETGRNDDSADLPMPVAATEKPLFPAAS